MLLAQTTGNKIGLGLVGALFIAFALVSALVVPRYRPEFPGKSGLRVFIALTIVLFAGMMAAVHFFGKEEEEPEQEQPAAVE